jgi:hypothetical protein
MRISLLVGDASPDTAKDFDDATIADLSPQEISRMIRDELVRVIRGARLRQLNTASDKHLEYYDRSTLERLVYLARRCCRHRTTALQPRRSVVTGGA